MTQSTDPLAPRRTSLERDLAYFDEMAEHTARDRARHDESALWKALATDVRRYLHPVQDTPLDLLDI